MSIEDARGTQRPATPEDIRKAQRAVSGIGIKLGASLAEISDVIHMITPDDDYQHHSVTGNGRIRLDVTKP